MKARKNRVSPSQVNLLNYLFFLFSLFLTDSLFCRSEKRYECVYINSTSNSGFIPFRFIFISSQFLIVLDKRRRDVWFLSNFLPRLFLFIRKSNYFLFLFSSHQNLIPLKMKSDTSHQPKKLLPRCPRSKLFYQTNDLWILEWTEEIYPPSHLAAFATLSFYLETREMGRQPRN